MLYVIESCKIRPAYEGLRPQTTLHPAAESSQTLSLRDSPQDSNNFQGDSAPGQWRRQKNH